MRFLSAYFRLNFVVCMLEFFFVSFQQLQFFYFCFWPRIHIGSKHGTTRTDERVLRHVFGGCLHVEGDNKDDADDDHHNNDDAPASLSYGWRCC